VLGSAPCVEETASRVPSRIVPRKEGRSFSMPAG
jgi:hypothetical protein